MTLLAPIPIGTVLTAFGVLAALAVIAYILKMRRRRFEVPFSLLWNRVLREKEATALWKHLRRIVSLLIQLVILGLIMLAVLEPELGEADADARSVVVIVDASASMKTMDEGPDGDRPRIEIARKEAHALLRALGGGDAAMIMRMDGQTTPLSRFGSDMPMLHKVIDGIEASDTPADLGRALRAAADALRERKNPMLVIIGDGAYPAETLGRVVWTRPARAPGTAAEVQDDNLATIDLSGMDVRFVPVGQSGENAGIVAFSARRYLADKTSYSVLVEAQNFGLAPTSRKLVVYSGDTAVDVKIITLAPGQRVREIYPNLSGGQDSRLRAELQPVDAGSGRDVLPLDDKAWALLPARKKQKVLLVTRDNLYLEGAMLVYEDIQVDKLTPEDYDTGMAAGEVPAYDAVVFDDYTPAALPPEGTHLIYFHPAGEHSPFPVRRTVEGPRITEVDEAHPVMRWVVMSDVNFDAADVLAVDRDKGEQSLARYVRDTVIAAKRDGARKIVAFGFALSGTDLTLRVAFPLLLVNTLDWFAGDDADLITTYQTGHRFRVPMDGVQGVAEAEVKTPVGRVMRAPLVNGQATFYGNFIGVHRLVARDGNQVVAQLELAANLANPDESNVAPQRELVMGERRLEPPPAFTITPRRSLWMYLVLAALVLICAEWVTYHRRITV